MRYNEESFTKFLKEIDLQKYKDQYSKIKTVEMDLPRNIQALDTIYNLYWNKTQIPQQENNLPLSFDEFYNIYYNDLENNINEFWEKTGFEKECSCFKNGLKARIYRTWASLITQIHAGYVAESVFGIGNVEMSTLLDHQGVDMLIHYKNNDIKVQIKKDSKRPEISRMHSIDDNSSNDIFNIWYIVPSPHDYENPFYSIRTRAGELRDCNKQFKKFNDNGTLDRLDNGFVIFTTKEFELIKETFDKKEEQNA